MCGEKSLAKNGIYFTLLDDQSLEHTITYVMGSVSHHGIYLHLRRGPILQF